ncbi:hypothetical protein D3273_27375 [Lichenibacterium minor]|uniref:Uncharacterized protein n=1 Tax=Lichenibacterium minor TaxID=2316528 RepID=A0A4Q2TXK2_9HYPH|nr:hypothetical protein [Lichenibacterium minor]RYC28803.1 hypothetical protein D3273_27375 [Lichenibacterium minor]
MNLHQVEIIESAWRILNASASDTAHSAADAIALFLQELDDDGLIDRLNEGRSGKDLIAGIVAALGKKTP